MRIYNENLFFHKFVVHKFVDFLYLPGVSGIAPGEAAREGVAVQPYAVLSGEKRSPRIKCIFLI